MQNTLLCQAIADRSGREVVAGPVEATALGNVLVQARAAGAVTGGLDDLRALVRVTHDLRRFTPRAAREQDAVMRVALLVTCINDAMYPRHRARPWSRCCAGSGSTSSSPSAQTCCAQPMVNTGYLDEAVPVVRTFVDAFAGYDAIVTPSGSCAGSARHQHSIVARRSGDPALEAAVAETGPRTYELSEFLVDVLGVTDVGAYFPHTVTYHPTCHSLRMLGVGDRPRQLLEQVRGLTLVDLPAGRGVLRLRRHLRGEERRHLGRHGLRQGAARARDRRRDGGGRRQLLPDAHRRAALARALRRTHRAPRRDPGGHRGDRGPLRRTGRRRPGGGAGMNTGTFVGMPAFPEAARAALGDTQLRHNLAHATRTIRDKRARVVAEVEDWEELRVAGAAVKEAALRDLATHLEQLEAALIAGGATVHWARDAAEACAIVASGHPRRTAPTRWSRSSRWPPPRSGSTRRSRPRASPRGRPTWPSSSCSSATTCPRTSWCRPSTATAPRSARSSVAGWPTSGGPPPTT